MEKVALLKCDNYDLDLVEKKIREGFELLGGDSYIKSLIPYNSKLLLKPNMLSAEARDSIVVTSPVIFEAVIRIVKDYTDNISFGDSPGFGDSKRAALKIGLMDIADRYGVRFDEFKEEIHVRLDDSLLIKSWNVSKAAYESDVLITLPRIKTHAMAHYTGAIKNQFGCVIGTSKASFHTRVPEAENFSKMLLDLNKVVNTSFAILDGIVAMEGNGPKSGTPYNLKSIVMGGNLPSVDSVGSYLIGYNNPLDIPALKEALNSGYKGVLLKDIDVLGENIDNLKSVNFKKAIERKDFTFGNNFLNNTLRNLVTPNPWLNKEKCISCKRCSEVCPKKPRVISMKEENGKLYPDFNLTNCIRCFCCQELCPVGAIEPKYSLAARALKFNKR
ncbi:MAG: DUF362 domain-containing protein [Bacillota bacterium]|nr:DUF362 domain-containing protein [Bacillota bacterium]